MFRPTPSFLTLRVQHLLRSVRATQLLRAPALHAFDPESPALQLHDYITMKKTITAILLSVLFAVGCTKSKAPGTKPSDMTAEQHRQACVDQKRKGDANQKRADALNGGKGTYTAETAAENHNDIAMQHENAGKQLDPTLGDCK